MDPFNEFRGTGPSSAFDQAGQARAPYAPIIELIRNYSKSDSLQRQKRLTHAIEELGLQVSAATSVRSDGNPWGLDPFPLSPAA